MKKNPQKPIIITKLNDNVHMYTWTVQKFTYKTLLYFIFQYCNGGDLADYLQGLYNYVNKKCQICLSSNYHDNI
jgi:hypothetical protein